MNNEYIRQLAFDSLYLEVKCTKPDDLSTIGMTEQEVRMFYKYFEKFKGQVVRHMDDMKV